MVDFDTFLHVASHGKEPRGTGCWAFGLNKNPDVCDPDQTLWSPRLPYAAAKKWAVAQVKARFGKDANGTLYVLS